MYEMNRKSETREFLRSIRSTQTRNGVSWGCSRAPNYDREMLAENKMTKNGSLVMSRTIWEICPKKASKLHFATTSTQIDDLLRTEEVWTISEKTRVSDFGFISSNIYFTCVHIKIIFICGFFGSGGSLVISRTIWKIYPKQGSKLHFSTTNTQIDELLSTKEV